MLRLFRVVVVLDFGVAVPFSNIEESMFERARNTSVRAPQIKRFSFRNLQSAMSELGVATGITFAFAAMPGTLSLQNSAAAGTALAGEDHREATPSSGRSALAERSQRSRLADSTV